jgi:hypothetical protein
MRMAQSVGFEGSISRGDFGLRIGVGTVVDLDQVVTRRHDPPATEGGEPVEVLETIADNLGHHVSRFRLVTDAGELGDFVTFDAASSEPGTAAPARGASRRRSSQPADTSSTASQS